MSLNLILYFNKQFWWQKICWQTSEKYAVSQKYSFARRDVFCFSKVINLSSNRFRKQSLKSNGRFVAQVEASNDVITQFELGNVIILENDELGFVLILCFQKTQQFLCF